MALDAAWHRAHPMPEKATFEQRVAWHWEHVRACGCRKPPADIAAVLAAEPDAPSKRSPADE
jgi:hypothetical protein